MKLQLHAYGIWVVYILVSQGFVNATLLIIDSLDRTLDNFETRDATPNVDVMEGYIEYSDPSDACGVISLPNFPQNFTMKKIVLINGTTTCNLITKVQNANQAGYDVVVLFDPTPGPFEYNITFPLSISEVNMSVVLVLFEDGIVIRDNYLYNIGDKDNFKIRIHPDVKAWAAIMLCFIVMFCCYLITSFLICILNLCIDLFRNHNGQQNVNHDPLIRILPDVINEQNVVRGNEEECKTALCNLRRRCPSEVFSKDHLFEVCVICRYNFEVGENIRVLHCFHAYHTHCIDKWLVYNKETCPLCVAQVNLEDSYKHPTECTPLLTSSQDLYPASRIGNGSSPSNPSDAAYDNIFFSTTESGELLAEAQGSVN